MNDGFLNITGNVSQKQLVRRIKYSLKHYRRAWFVSWKLDTETISELAEQAKCDWLYSPETGEVRFFEFM